ncbi:MAG TPA: thiamine-phosphate kinase [Paludibacteraceae bacterium]|nr:thiamine-phosphate kinase [Paludibacteraceae bacterium]HQB69575.1 thiamine-phosphate kinase [Paludibacteraceae bacterium]HRS68135.1 thiamine-phosphate kinase [Paludibacteraceae bacterium]
MKEQTEEKLTLESLGEFGLIKHLTKSIKLKNKSSLKGVGDDAAVLDFGQKKALVTTDILLEGIHFDLTYTPLKHLGYKAAMVNFSDICAMNGIPTQLLVSIGVSQRFALEQIEEVYAGIHTACEQYHVDLVGGDTTSSLTGLTLSLTCLGEADENKIVYRNGAKVNDLICVTGDLGAAYAGLQLLEREKLVFQGQQDPAFQPDFAGKEYILERQLKPEARKDIIENLAKAKILPTAMIDVSDGLSSELLHICTQSNVGCRIYEEKLPIDYITATMCEEFNLNLTTAALNGGEDYELLFTVPLALHDAVKALDNVHIIGHITDVSEGLALITRDGQEFTIQAQGWTAFAHEQK